MRFDIEYEREEDGRWIAAIEALPGVMVYAETRSKAKRKVVELAQAVMLDKV